jgi:hypothetical protein
VPIARPATARYSGGNPGCVLSRSSVSAQLAQNGRCRPPQPTSHLLHAHGPRPPQRDLLPNRKGEMAPGRRPRRPQPVKWRYFTRHAEPPAADRLQKPPPPSPRPRSTNPRRSTPAVCLPRHWRPARRLQLAKQSPIRTPPARHHARLSPAVAITTCMHQRRRRCLTPRRDGVSAPTFPSLHHTPYGSNTHSAPPNSSPHDPVPPGAQPHLPERPSRQITGAKAEETTRSAGTCNTLVAEP